MENLLDKVSPDEALAILKKLAKADKMIEQKIVKIADDIIRNVDVEESCDEVFFVLDGIDVQDLWDRSGSTSYGYNSPEDMAVEMMEDELDPFNKEVFRLNELNMRNESMRYCMGVLKGIYKYAHESKSEFKDWATDVPGECFGYLVDEWKKRSKNKTELKEMNSFLKKECSRWA